MNVVMASSFSRSPVTRVTGCRGARTARSYFSGDLAIRQRSPRITSESAAQMLDTFAMQQGGSQYRRLIRAFQRIFGATIFFGTDSQRERAAVVHWARFSFMNEARIWYSRDPDQTLLPGDCQNAMVLSQPADGRLRS